MAPRANWRGYLKLGALHCPVALYTAATEGERIHLHTLNRETGHRVRRQFVDEETGEVVERDEQAKGYEVGDGRFVVLEQAEIDAVIPASTRTIEVEAFVPEAEFDPVFVDRPYYLAPTDRISREAFAVIRAAMESRKVVGIGRTVLFRRDRSILLCPRESGFVASTLHFDYEVRAAEAIFAEVPERNLDVEMVDLVRHIIATKRGRFDPAAFEDHYETALAELIRAKKDGKPMPKPVERKAPNVVSLLDALRESAGAARKATGKKPAAKKPAARKATARKTAAKAPAAKAAPRRRAG
ncbi:non-homologous end joining protein Ku [Allostella vacuolata]|nr:non-homologous end joining protein Ku [Stella vacuolata]